MTNRITRATRRITHSGYIREHAAESAASSCPDGRGGPTAVGVTAVRVTCPGAGHATRAGHHLPGA